MIVSTFFSALHAVLHRPRPTCLWAWPAAISVAAALVGCSPYPDDGEFLAGVVYANGFIAGVKSITKTPAVGRGMGQNGYYTVISTTRGSDSGIAVTKDAPAVSPFWNNAGKRQPLDKSSAQPVYVFDSGCAAPLNYKFDDRLDLIRRDRQYPLFSDIPEVLSANAGKAGRTAAYSAIVEVIHISASGALPCQSIKRFDTAKGRLGEDGDLHEGEHEYRLFQIIDPAIAVPLPVQLGFYNQLVVPYIDMGKVPLDKDGKTFLTMPLFKLLDAKNAVTWTVTLGESAEAGSTYSPICRDYTMPAGMTLPIDASDPVLQTATRTESLASCLVCRTLNSQGNLDCPFANSQGAP